MNIVSGRQPFLRGALCFILAVSLVSAARPVSAQDTSAAKVKTTLSNIGTGEKARVKANLKNGDVLTGYISALEEEDFTIVSKEGAQKVLYTDVEKVKKQGLRLGIQIAIFAGIMIGILIGIGRAVGG